MVGLDTDLRRYDEGWTENRCENSHHEIALFLLHAPVKRRPSLGEQLQPKLEFAADSLQIAQRLMNGSIQDCAQIRLAQGLPRCEDLARRGAEL